MPPTEFGNLLRALRAQRGLRLQDLADKTGLTHVTVGDWERGKRNPKRANVEAIAAALEVDPEPLLLAAGFVPTSAARTETRVELPGGYALQVPQGDPNAALIASITEAALRAISAGQVEKMPDLTPEQQREVEDGMRRARRKREAAAREQAREAEAEGSGD
jgi:transcriptional regulator with XRE-family HTH domain